MKQVLSSPWFAVSAGILGIVVGYLLVMNPAEATAKDAYCPYRVECANGECDKNADCANGECSKSCPGNCHANSEGGA